MPVELLPSYRVFLLRGTAQIRIIPCDLAGSQDRSSGGRGLRRHRASLASIPEVTMSNTEMLIRLVVAAALGSLIGFERERLLWAAGIRTHMLVCVGACLFMLVSAFGFSAALTMDH